MQRLRWGSPAKRIRHHAGAARLSEMSLIPARHCDAYHAATDKPGADRAARLAPDINALTLDRAVQHGSSS